MNPLGSRASRSYSARSMAAASGTGRGSTSRSMRNPAAKISPQVLSNGASQYRTVQPLLQVSWMVRGVEVATPVAQPIPRRMQAGQHQRAIRPQYPPQLAQRGHPVIDVFDRQRAQGQVDTLIGYPADRITQVVHAELTLAYSRPADLYHPRAVAEPHHRRPATDQFGSIKAWSARCV